MQVSIVGAGNQGTALGAALVRGGHQVLFGSREPARKPAPAEGAVVGISEAVRRSRVIALVVPSWHLDGTLAAMQGPDLHGKIVIDVTNPLTAEKEWATGFSTSNAEKVAAALSGARVVKAFNTVFSPWLRSNGTALGEQLTGFVAADDTEAKQLVLGLVKDIGLDPVDAGGLQAARLLEAAGVMLVRFGAFTPLGWELGLRLVHPRSPVL